MINPFLLLMGPSWLGTVIFVRVSMGLSSHDEDSLVNRVGSLGFASADSNPIPESGGVGDQESPGGNLEDIEIQLSADSDIHRDIDNHVSG